MRHWQVWSFGLILGSAAAQDPVQGGRPGPAVPLPVAAGPAKDAGKGQDQAPAKPPVAQLPGAKPADAKVPDSKPGATDATKPDVKAAGDGKPAGKPATGDTGEDPGAPPAQLPKSADPSDIAAMQSAQNMLKAEARLRKMLKAGEIKGIDKILTFEELSSWPYQDGLKGCPEAVKKMDGKTVLMTGFMLPIDEVENIKEFLLVQSLWSCCYGQPPDINGIVRVRMKGDKRISYKYDPIKVTGQFKVVASYEDGYCIDIFQLQADEVELIK